MLPRRVAVLVGAHLAAGPAGYRRCRRHERLRAAERAARWPAAASRWRSSPARRRRPTRRWSRWRPACWCATWWRAVRGARQKYDLPTQLCAFTAGVLRAEATHEPGYYDIVHSHYWLSGQVGWLARDRWAVPLVHTAHTLAAVKNAALAERRLAEPAVARHRRAAGGRRGRPADRQHRTSKRSNWFRCTTPTRRGSTWCTPASTSSCSRLATSAPRAPRWASTADEQVHRVRRPHPAAEGARCAAAGGGQTARGARGDRRRPVGQRAGRTGGADSAGRRAGHRRPGRRFLPPQSREQLVDVYRAAGPASRCPAIRVLRPGRRRGAGLRHAGGGGRGRWAAGGGARRGHRRAWSAGTTPRTGPHAIDAAVRRAAPKRCRARGDRRTPPPSPGRTPWTRCWAATAAPSPTTGARHPRRDAAAGPRRPAVRTMPPGAGERVSR